MTESDYLWLRASIDAFGVISMLFGISAALVGIGSVRLVQAWANLRRTIGENT